MNGRRLESVIGYRRPTEIMSPASLVESIEQKAQAAKGSKTTSSPLNTTRVTNRSVTRQYKFTSRKDYRDFFNSLSPTEANYLESPIPTDIPSEADGSVVIGFRLPS